MIFLMENQYNCVIVYASWHMLSHTNSALAFICVQADKYKHVKARVNTPVPSTSNSWALLTRFFAIPSDKFKKGITDSLMVAKREFWNLLVQTHHAVQNVNQNIFKYIIDEYFHQADLMIMYIHIETDISHSQSWLHIRITWEVFKKYSCLGSLSPESLFNLAKSGHQCVRKLTISIFPKHTVLCSSQGWAPLTHTNHISSHC